MVCSCFQKGQRQKQLEAKKIRDELEEKKWEQMDKEEAEYQEKKRREAIEKAKTQLFYHTHRVRGLHVGISFCITWAHLGVCWRTKTMTGCCYCAPTGCALAVRGSEGEGGSDWTETAHQECLWRRGQTLHGHAKKQRRGGLETGAGGRTTEEAWEADDSGGSETKVWSNTFIPVAFFFVAWDGMEVCIILSREMALKSCIKLYSFHVNIFNESFYRIKEKELMREREKMEEKKDGENMQHLQEQYQWEQRMEKERQAEQKRGLMQAHLVGFLQFLQRRLSICNPFFMIHICHVVLVGESK